MNTFLQQKQPAFLAHTLRYFDDIDLDINSISISRVSEEYEDKIYKTIMSISINEAFLSESFKKVLVNTIKKKTEVSFYFFSIDELANVLSKIDSLDYYISHLSGNMIEIVFFNLNRNSLNQRLKPYNLNVDDEGTLIILQEQEPTWPARSAI